MSEPPRFGSRLGMMLAMLGMAVGTGNIWRFPRIAASNGGGEFLIPWIVFLFLWSIPLVLLEFGFGRKLRVGPVKAFEQTMGPRWAWMGGFVAFVTVAIMFYYSVVAGWTIRYTVAALVGEIPESRPGSFWTRYTDSFWPVATHAAAIGLGIFVVARGVGAIERAVKVLMPTLLVLVLVLTVRAVTLPGASEGLEYLFGVDWSALGRAELWIQALTQNAWDTGAGWGLILCYAAYLREREDTALNAYLLPAANNAVSLLAGMMVICTVFSVVPALVEGFAARPETLEAYPALAEAIARGEEVTSGLIRETIFGAGNEGLTFIWMPQLFATLPGGRILMVLFFAALAFAAFTSLIAMLELATRVLVDMGMRRRRAIVFVGLGGFLFGIPSAVSLPVFKNQDWVWGMALMLSGLFFAIAVWRAGIRKLREEHLNHADSDVRVGAWWDVVIGVLVPIEAVVLVVWWLAQAREDNREGWLDPFAEYSVGTVLAQFAVVLAVLIAVTSWHVRRRSARPS